MVRVGDPRLARRLVVVEVGPVGAAQRGDDAREDDRDPVAAGVHDTGLAQHRQQVGAALDAGLPRLDRRLEDPGQQGVLELRVGVGTQPGRGVGQVGELGGDPRGHLTHDGEHRSLGGLADRAVRAVGRAGHRGPDQPRVDELAGPADQLLRGPADELGEDDAAVAAGAEERGAGDRVDDLVAADEVQRPVLGREPVDLGQAGAQRERHVVARIAVGDREDVEVVDLLTARLEVRERALYDRAEPDETGIGHAGGTGGQIALTTLPAFRQRVQTYTRLGAPAINARTFWRFGSKRRRVATIEWLRLFPKDGPFPQLWQTLAIARLV